MPLTSFHPLTRRWWAARFALPGGGVAPPTAAQAEGWTAIRSGAHTLIAAPTGSGKTLAAFLNSLDELLCEGLENGGLPDEVRVVYVSPLKALSNDIHRNLAEPRRGLQRLAEEEGLPPVRVRAAVRTGDTPQSERAAMLRVPPHILVTTPESLYLLLTAERSRAMLRSVRTVIVDEIHAVIESRRGAHLALTLERLDHAAACPVQRIGLSATQKPIEHVARFLVGPRADAPVIVDHGHARRLDLELLMPASPLEAVMSNEAWDEIIVRLVDLIRAHGTTLVFANTRRLAERLTGRLAEHLGEEMVTTHHGSLSKERRLDAETRLKEGKLRALVATSSLELGIDIGHLDLVVQLGSPRRISALLQRVGRSGHTVGGTPKGRIVPLTRDELIECTALLGALRAGELDRVIIPETPLDILAQQIVAETAAEDWSLDGLFELIRGAWPYRALERATFDDVVETVARGYTTRRGRRGALLHLDAVNGRVRGRRGARLTAITSGGAIPEVADYRVVLEPEGVFVGTVDEDFAIESMAGDVFQLGATSWRILRIENGTVRVADAQGEPPGIPFWFGEAPARSDELSFAVSALRAGVDRALEEGNDAAALQWLTATYEVDDDVARQIVRYLGESRRLLGVIPTQDTLVLERFFDEAGGMQLILHAPFGARVNRAWGLSLRKKFCRTFNFELQAAATEEGLLLSLGPQHSFPLGDVFRYLHPSSVKDVLVQAVLDSPLFQTRWRWNVTLSLAVLRNRNGVKVAPQIQRMQAEDVLAAVFPDAAACLENIAGDREVPDHPLVSQALKDCLEEAMDLPHLERLLGRIHASELRLIARDTPEPSPLCHELLNARPYAFLDDAPLEERRARAVYTRRALEPSSAADLGALDLAAIERVRLEVAPAADNEDELHDVLLTCGFLTDAEARRLGGTMLDRLCAYGRAQSVNLGGRTLWFAAERLDEVRVLLGEKLSAVQREDALREVLRGRMEIAGPMTVASLAALSGLGESDVEYAMFALEAQGGVLRGFFTPGVDGREWCDRRLLARIHRYTIHRLRAEIEPVSISDYIRFLFRWQHAEPASHMAGVEGLFSVIEQLQGFEAQAATWESDLLPARCATYAPEALDHLSAAGRVVWGRLSPPGSASPGLIRTSPITLLVRADAGVWLREHELPADIGSDGRQLLDVFARRGASFAHELAREAELPPTRVEQALAELAAAGLVTSDGFTGLRALLTPAGKRASPTGSRRRRNVGPWSVEGAGRWARLHTTPIDDDERVRAATHALLCRWGVLFRRLLDREPGAPSWREIVYACRRMEARGELRGGRFLAGVSGEQFALPEAVATLRAIRKERAHGAVHVIGAADPLNLTGVLIPGERIACTASNRIAFRDGIPIAVLENRRFRTLRPLDDVTERIARQALVRTRTPPILRSYLRTGGRGRSELEMSARAE